MGNLGSDYGSCYRRGFIPRIRHHSITNLPSQCLAIAGSFSHLICIHSRNAEQS